MVIYGKLMHKENRPSCVSQTACVAYRHT